MNKSNELAASITLRVAIGSVLPWRVRQLVAATSDAARVLAQNGYTRRRERQRLQVAFDAMRHLDDHLLRDVGFERGVSTQPKETYDVYRH